MSTMSPGSERDDGEELGDDAVKLILRLKKVHHCSDCMKMPWCTDLCARPCWRRIASAPAYTELF